MGTEPIHFAASASPLTLVPPLCVNRIIYNDISHLKLDANADALCERAITVPITYRLYKQTAMNAKNDDLSDIWIYNWTNIVSEIVVGANNI